MSSDVDFAREALKGAGLMFTGQTEGLSLEDARFSAGGYRSALGVMKHIGAWLHIYRSYAFDGRPRHWAQTSWPRGLVDEVELSQAYVDEVRAWVVAGLGAWDASLSALLPGQLDEPRPLHWGEKMPLRRIVLMTANHVTYHTGELNMLLSIKKGEAWEYTEEVEENHISTYGHGVPAEWMTPEQRSAYEDRWRVRDEARRPART